MTEPRDLAPTNKTETNGVAHHATHGGPLYPSRTFAGRRFVVVGGTGFLGKVWVSMFLHRFPEIDHLFLLVRPKADQSPEERFWSQIVTSPTFDPLREKYPGDAFETFLKAKVTPVAGDVGEPLLGLGDELTERLVGAIDSVVNVAGVVDFNPPLDDALEVNAFGVNNLVSLARKLGAKVLHTSTCYVAGYRAGLIEEADPREVPFPRSAGETWYGAACPKRTLDRSHWDPQREIEECLDLVKTARHRCEDAFRQSAFLDEAKQNLLTRGEPTRGRVLDEELAKVKRKFIKDQLIAAGQERAIFWGFSNIYTYTKSIGEQVLAASGLPFTIVRPAVIESSVVYPFAGWNEGINTSAPFLYMASKGQVQFPGAPDVHLDIIPVDMVTSGMIASLAELVDGTQKAVYHYGSSDTNPCTMTRYLEIAGLYRRRQVFDGKRTGIFDLVSSRFESMGLTKKQYERQGARTIAKTMDRVGSLLGAASVGPLASFLKPASKALKSAAKTEHRTADIMEIFLPFVAEADWVFSNANTRAAMDRMPPEERARFYWEPEKIDWRVWMYDVHLPGLEKWVYPLIEERMQKELKPLRPHETLVDLLDEMVERHDHAVALQRVTPEGLTRTTFREWREDARTVAARLAAIGVKQGDRVILAGNNDPAWAIAYFGILTAGAVVVPVDPALEAAQLTNIARSSGAKVALWDQAVEKKGGAPTLAAVQGLQAFDLQELAQTARAHEGELTAPRVDIKKTDVASLIYTSGTTGEPKGVMLSHGNFTSLLASLAPIFPLGEHDRILSVLPLHHTFEFTCGLLLPLSRGARIVYLDELTAEKLGDTLKKARITGMVGVPALWQMLERRIHATVKEQGPVAALAFNYALDLNRLLGKRLGMSMGRLFFGQVHAALGGNTRFLISGGAALPKGTADLFRGLGLPLSEGYGLTEASPVLTVSKAGPKQKPGQVGKPIPGVEIKIANPDDRGIGEVLARGANVMLGYANNPAATEAVLDKDGWLHTGDLGKFDDRKQLVIVGRQKDVIVSASGENVYPDDIENLLGKIAHVKEIAIVGVDDPKGGERVACLAVPDQPPAPGSDDVLEIDRAERHANAMTALKQAFAKLPKSAYPAVVHLYEADLPRTATRKVKRSEVKLILARLIAATDVPPPSMGASTSPVRHAIATIANKKAHEISSGMRLKADLGFDSLMTLELASALEAQLGRTLDPTRVTEAETVADVEALVAEPGLTHPIERAEKEPLPPIIFPRVVADKGKEVMGRAQMGFYSQVMRPKVYGRAYIPHNRNTIVASNHSSHLDMGFVKWALGTYGEGLVSLAAQDYFFDGPRWRRAYFENFTNLAPFDRKGGLRQGMRQAGDVIDAGKTILLFPEGTRSTNGAIQEFKSVIGHLALTHEVDILPVYLAGTFEALPKGSVLIPRKRNITARIGPPLEVADLKRLTQGMKLAQASRKVAELTRMAVLALKDGTVLDLKRAGDLDQAEPQREHPLVGLFRELEGKFKADRVTTPITYYFTLGAETEAKWTLTVKPDGCTAQVGKPAGSQADCVLKTTPEIFTRIVREAYTPSPMEFMTGAVKSNDISLLQTFQKVFDLA